MATIYFKKSLVNTALDIIKFKGTIDKAKAKDDLDQIDSILISYSNGYRYDPMIAHQLDQRIVREYPIIERIETLLSSQTSHSLTSNSTFLIDPIIRKLSQDRYGIMFDVLLKEGCVQRLEDFVERVE